MDFELYKKWATDQKCCDCGESASNKTGPWVTETQCWKCWEEKGAPENRGLPSAGERFDDYGVNAQAD